MKALIAAVALLAAACVPPSGPVEVAENPLETALAHTVKLSGCTGIRVHPTRVVTAKHCLEDDAKVGDSYEGGRVTHIGASDWAVFGNPGPLWAPYIEMRPARLGEHLYVVGYPVQLEDGKVQLTVTDGIAAGPTDNDGFARITAPVYFGNSGGGVWGDDGALLGVAVAIYAAHVEDYQYPLPYVGQSWMVPIESILPVLR